MELDQYLKRHPGTVQLDAFVHDLNGTLRGKRLPVAEAAKAWDAGLEMPRSLLFLDPTGDDLDPGGRSTSLGDPDGTAVPVAGSLAPVPWMPEATAQVLLQMTDPPGAPNAGKPSRLCPRAALAGMLDRFECLEMTPVVAVELEFYLLAGERDEDGAPRPVQSTAPGRQDAAKQPHSIEDLDAYEAFLGRVASYARQQGIPASAATAENAPGQFEINLRHQPDAVAACDHAVLLKRLIKAAARHEGHRASFMAKPFLQAAGSGMHIHVSLLDRAGCNLLGPEASDGNALLGRAIAGLQAAMPESMAIFGASRNGFRRYRPGHNVPLAPSWGCNNRSVAFRIPAGAAAARRIEHRVAGADANPYLVVAAVLSGILHGFADQLRPTPETRGDAGGSPDPAIPFELGAALDRLAAAEILPRYIDPEMLSLLLDQKRAELAKLADAIPRREYDWYL
jgi:glutamine synthetase